MRCKGSAVILGEPLRIWERKDFLKLPYLKKLHFALEEMSIFEVLALFERLTPVGLQILYFNELLYDRSDAAQLLWAECGRRPELREWMDEELARQRVFHEQLRILRRKNPALFWALIQSVLGDEKDGL